MTPKFYLELALNSLKKKKKQENEGERKGRGREEGRKGGYTRVTNKKTTSTASDASRETLAFNVKQRSLVLLFFYKIFPNTSYLK